MKEWRESGAVERLRWVYSIRLCAASSVLGCACGAAKRDQQLIMLARKRTILAHWKVRAESHFSLRAN